MTQALILAAGNGSRLGAAANGMPKCMVRVGPRTLIEHQIGALRASGVERIGIVVGYGEEHVRRACGDGFTYIRNERFKDTNSVYSLWLAREWVDAPFFLLNCDVLFDPRVLGRLAQTRGSSLAMDSLSGNDPEHMKVAVRDGLVCGLSKSMAVSRTRGENLGVLRFDRGAADELFHAAGQIVDRGGENSWAPAAVEQISIAHDVRAVDCCDLPWCEIDFPGDLDDARFRVWPRIEQESGGTRAAAPSDAPVVVEHDVAAPLAGAHTELGISESARPKEIRPMSRSSKLPVLFTGYAWVHFACFRPLYERLAEHEGVDVYVSGGLRSDADVEEGEEGAKVYDLRGMYDPFGIPEDRMLTVEQIKERDFGVVFAANTKMILPRTTGCRIQIFHGISFRNKAVRDENAGADYYFMVGPYMRRAFAESGILPENDPRALKIGFPKTDRLLNGEVDRQGLMRRIGFTGRRPILVYAPTGQKKNSLETMGEEVIGNIAATGRYDLIIKPHDHPKNLINWDERLAPLLDEHTKIVRDGDVIPLLLLADLLITDASSVSSEFALRDQPMVFLDVPDLLAKASALGGSRVDLKTWGRRCGVLVESASDVVDAIDSSLAYPFRYSEVRRSMSQDLFYNAGHATEAAMAWFTRKFLSSDAPKAASAALRP